MFIKKNLLILKKIFVKDEKFNHSDIHSKYNVNVTQGEKRSYDDEEDDHDNDIISTDVETI